MLEVTDIQKGCTHDGPGLRTTVFLKGCPLRCKWCHNPETQSKGRELFFRPAKCIGCFQCVAACPQGCHQKEGDFHSFDPTRCIHCMECTKVCPGGALEPASKTMEIAEVVEQVLADKIFYRNRGGMTVSGGEPTAQKQGLLDLLDAVKAENIHTCLETCGVFPESLVPELAQRVDLFLYDVKDTDPQRLKENTGADLSLVLGNLRALDALGKETVMRCILIPEINLNQDHAKALADIFESLNHCRHIELLAYHPYGLSKSEQLGRCDVRYTQPEQAELEKFAEDLKARNIPVKLYGSML